MNNLMKEIKEKTTILHKATESSGITKRLINKNATLESYTEYIYNLSFVYAAIETNLEKYKDVKEIKSFVTPEVYRTDLLKKDLEELGYSKDSEVLHSTLAYVDRINSISETNPKLLVAHAYTRFLADLFGGRIFYSLLKDHYKINPEALNYYLYDDIEDIKSYVMKYHNMLNTFELNDDEKEQFILEICNSYIYNMAISNELDCKLF